MDISFPIYYDSLNVMGRLNNIVEIPCTLLLDYDNRIVMGGSPIQQEFIKRKYKEYILSIKTSEPNRE